ncbi:MAG: aldehyde dehydrogenase family protein [Candidatus Micrarchaeota archaeon]
MASYKLLINGKWINSSSGKTFTSVNPATGKALATFQAGDAKDVRRAIDAAEVAFGKWSALPPPTRAKILFKAAELLRKDKQRLGRLVTIEMGKVLSEALGDVQEAIDVFEYMAGEGRRLFGHTTTSELQDKFAMTIRQPEGVCGLITPWNFPTAIPAWKLAPALICGNSVVLKPSSDTPLCATEMVKILEKAGVPPGVVNMVTGGGSTVGLEMVKNRKIWCLSFTGSKETGEWITANAGLKKVGLELGGKNPIIIMDDADLGMALDGVIWGAFGTTGQRCTAASRVLIHKKVKGKFLDMLVSRTRKLRLGDGLRKATDVGPLINRAAAEKSARYVQIGKDEGAKLMCGGKAPSGKGYFFMPTVFSDVSSDMRIAKEEIFGPVLSVIDFSNINQAIDIANSVEYGLSSSIYTRDITNSFRAIQNLRTGITYVNSSTIGAEVHLPFGGVKGTGHTREAGIEGIDEFSHSKTVYVDYSGKLQKAQIDAE